MPRHEARLFACTCLLPYLLHVLNRKFILIFFFGFGNYSTQSIFFFNSFIVFGCKWLKTTNCKLTSNVRRVFSYTLQVFVGGKHVRGYMHVFSRRMSSFGRVWCLEAIMSFHSSCMLRWYHTFIHCCAMTNYYFVILILSFEADLPI